MAFSTSRSISCGDHSPGFCDTSMALRIAESSEGSCSSRYSATCSSVTLRDNGRAKNHAPAATSTSPVTMRNQKIAVGVNFSASSA